MKLILVSMPWQRLRLPSLALGILSAVVERDTSWEVYQRYANIEWADYLFEASSGRITPEDYRQVESMSLLGAGDWVFSAVLARSPNWRAGQYGDYLRRMGADPTLATEMQELAAGFIERLAHEMAREAPDAVGFTSTFTQNIPSLAAAQRLKEIRPQTQILLGGVNASRPSGLALQRNYHFLDFVFDGEGEESLPRLLNHLMRGEEPRDVAGLSWWSGEDLVVNEPAERPLNMETFPSPAQAPYFAQLENATVATMIEPELVLESSRGCWWGQKHHCTFCGITGPVISFRSWCPERAVAELLAQVREHRILDVLNVDNILDLRYFAGVLPALADSGLDLLLHYEVKSNLTRPQIALLARAGAKDVEPGIESLSSAVLRLMKKGVTGTRNVAVMRDCAEAGVIASWAILYGFPGEDEEDYASLSAQMPALFHLRPPGGINRIELLRYSENFERRAELFAWSRPSECYSIIYDLPPDEIADIAYLYDYAPSGLGGPLEDALQEGWRNWVQSYPRSSLRASYSDGSLRIYDSRPGFSPRHHQFDDPAQVTAYLALADDLVSDGVRAALRRAGLEPAIYPIEDWLRDWRAQGLVYEDRGRFVALAVGVGRIHDLYFGSGNSAVVSADRGVR